MDRLIDIRTLTKIYPGQGLFGAARLGVTAVDRVSFGIDRGTVFGLVGESGCGKTSLVRALLYLDPPTSGEVWYDGTNLGGLSAAALRPFRRRMQIVFQDPNSALNPKMRIADSLAEGLINRGVGRPERERRIAELLELVGIPAAHGRRHPHEFSGGQKQRIVIARALAMDPDFLVLDEPVSNLDVSIQAQIINLLLDLRRELALTYLFISHDLNLVAYLSDRIGVMYRGRLVEIGATDDVMSYPGHPYTRKLFASIPGRSAAGGPAVDGGVEAAAGGAAGGGCPYGDDCDMGTPACGGAPPGWVEIRPGHRVACAKAGGRT
jgi:peptide/nickel transport system ATP-binding protein/oligopeptide transport system ATP-binding protein